MLQNTRHKQQEVWARELSSQKEEGTNNSLPLQQQPGLLLLYQIWQAKIALYCPKL